MEDIKIEKFNDHGSSCKGHKNFMLDCTYEDQKDRDLLTKVIGNHVDEEDK